MSTLQMKDSLTAVAVADGLVYLGHGENLLIVDTQNPQQPVQLSEIRLSPAIDPIQDIQLTADVAVVLTEDRLYLIDVHTPTQPTLLSQISVRGEGAAVKIQGTLAYVLSLTRGVSGGILSVLDIHTQTKPKWLGSYSFQDLRKTCARLPNLSHCSKLLL